MDVPSIRFLLLAIAAAAIFNISRAQAWRQGVLLALNLLFLATFVTQPWALLPYVAFLAMGFALIHMIRRGVSHALYAAAILTVLFVFCWLKKYTFLPPAIFITAPYLLVGLSYVFFRVMHLVIDARYPEDALPLGPVAYLNFTLNFTSLTSGPIQRYEDYHHTTVVDPLPMRPSDVAYAIERIVAGLFKVFVMAVLVSIAQERLAYHLSHDSPLIDRVGTGMALAALYPIFLYFNFAGYTDFVIGIGRLFRIALPENFNRPFSATSFIDYWNRWHMSLSNWLKTYVYNPLLTTMMRRIKSPTFLPYAGALALFVTFFLIGAWHGRTSKFLFFGLLNGAGVAANQAYRIILTKRMGRKPFNAMSANGFYRFACRGLTFSWVAFTLLWFWSDWPQLQSFVEKIGPVGVAFCWLVLPCIAAILLEIFARAHDLAMTPQFRERPLLNSRYFRTAWLSVMLFLVLVVQAVMDAGPPGIVYKDF